MELRTPDKTGASGRREDLPIPEGVPLPLSLGSLKWEVRRERLVDSTNDRAYELATSGCREGIVVLADSQRKGRGRSGSIWVGPTGKCLLFSMVLRPGLTPREVFSLTMAAALAVSEGIYEITGLDGRIKWPNDVLISGKKVAGILTEFPAGRGKVPFVVIGIGINVNFDPRRYVAIKNRATSLLIERGLPVSRIDLLCGVLVAFDRLYGALGSHGGAEVYSAWRSKLVGIGEWVSVRCSQGVCEGILEDVKSDGALVIRPGRRGGPKRLTPELAWGLEFLEE